MYAILFIFKLNAMYELCTNIEIQKNNRKNVNNGVVRKSLSKNVNEIKKYPSVQQSKYYFNRYALQNRL